MRKFAPIAMLMALLAALLVGGAASAQAGTDSWTQAGTDSWNCNKEQPKKVSCDHDLDITIIVEDVEVGDVTLIKIEDSFNNNDVIVKEILTGDINVAKNIAVEIFKIHDIIIKIGDVKICTPLKCS